MKIKILRAIVPLEENKDVIVYMHDDEQGTIETTQSFFDDYISALEIVERFERTMEERYENQSSSSTPSER